MTTSFTESKNRVPASTGRTAAEGGFWTAAAVVGGQWAAAQFPELDGVNLMAAAAIGAAGMWLSSVLRNLGTVVKSPVGRVLLGVRT